MIRKLLESMTAGMANTVMKEVTRIAQTSSGMRFSDMPGRALLEDRDDQLDRDAQR